MKEIITTVCRGQTIQLLWQPETEDVERYMTERFVPIEMAEGTQSFVDFRRLDHHNDLSDLPSACVTALQFYGDLAGQRPAKIMVNHTDADCVMTGLTLLGLLPRDILERLNPEIGMLDTEPMLADEDKMAFRDMIRLWQENMESVKRSGWSWLYGLQLWLDLYEHPEVFKETLNALDAREEGRKAMALEDYQAGHVSPSGRVLLIAPSRVKGQDVQFCRQEGEAPDTLEGWRHWCIISHVQRSGGVMISCPCRRVAELAFGPGGLKNVFPLLPSVDGKEWGGRESVGGSPRGVTFPPERLVEVLEIVEGSLRARTHILKEGKQYG